MNTTPGVLSLVPTPIGNYEDITLRALRVLREADAVVCESRKESARLLHHYGITKELYVLDEHNEKSGVPEIIEMLREGKQLALISDCGTPVFSDPGFALVQECIDWNIPVIPLPGTNSLLPALIASGFPVEPFYYAGWLSPKKEIRKEELQKLLQKHSGVIVLLETPYRLQRILEDVAAVFPRETPAVIAFELTTASEKFYRGTIGSLAEKAAQLHLKGEFVLLLHNTRSFPASARRTRDNRP